MRRTSAVILVVAFVSIGAARAAAGPPDPPVQPSAVVVASAESAERPVAARPRAARSSLLDALPRSLPLALVGSLLMGLAAAVRRAS